MEILRPRDASTFLELAGPLLERAEARNQLPLGIAGTVVTAPHTYDVVRLWVVRDHGQTVGAAIRTDTYPLVLGDPASQRALKTLITASLSDDPDVPGIVGNVPHVHTAARAISEGTGRTADVVLSQGVYGLEMVTDLPAARGRPRVAGAQDREILVAWGTAFAHEALPDQGSHERVERTIEARLGSADSAFWFWEDEGELVSMSSYGGGTPNGIRIGMVYTPPEHRRRGYATTLVAEQSRWLLDRGYRFCFLFTDLSNPTSNHIYTDIGYERICDSVEVRFRDRTTGASTGA